MGGPRRMRAPQPPRALLLATGERVPGGPSLRARLLIVDVAPGQVDRARLSECQRAGQKGQFAGAMGQFLSWIAGRYEELQQRLNTPALEQRRYGKTAVHARLPGALAQLQCGWEIWLQFAREAGALGPTEQVELAQRSGRALEQLATLQAHYHQASDPALQFVALLRAALTGGRAHVADRQGRTPESPEIWGWRRKPAGRGWIPQGTRVGWVARSDLFLEPAASYQVAQQAAGLERLPVSEQTLRHRLREHGLLASIDVGRQMLLVRRTLEGYPRQVLHLRASQLVSL